MSKSKYGGDSWWTLYGRPMEGLAFCFDRHEEISRYIWMGDMHYHAVVMHLFCLPLKILAGFVIPDTIQYNLIFNTFHKICILRLSLFPGTTQYISEYFNTLFYGMEQQIIKLRRSCIHVETGFL